MNGFNYRCQFGHYHLPFDNILKSYKYWLFQSKKVDNQLEYVFVMIFIIP
jgi:hypothetical protein